MAHSMFVASPDARRVLTCTQHKVSDPLQGKMATAAPPARPITRLPTAQRGRRYYTLHSNNNNAFSLKLNDNVRTAIVGFRELGDAVQIGAMIETHFIHLNEWPETNMPGPLVLPSSRLSELNHIFIRNWAADELKFECTNNFLDLISVDSLDTNMLNGNFITLEATDDFYRERIRQLYELA
jgi:hypothetical protein